VFISSIWIFSLTACDEPPSAFEQCVEYESVRLRIQPKIDAYLTMKQQGFKHFLPDLSFHLRNYMELKSADAIAGFIELQAYLDIHEAQRQHFEERFTLINSDVFRPVYQAYQQYDDYRINAQTLNDVVTACNQQIDCRLALERWKELESIDAQLFLGNATNTDTVNIRNAYRQVEEVLFTQLQQHISEFHSGEWQSLLSNSDHTSFKHFNERFSETEYQAEERQFKFIEFFLSISNDAFIDQASNALDRLKYEALFYQTNEYQSALLARFKKMTDKPTVEETAALVCKNMT
jgi:hypothetical protein